MTEHYEDTEDTKERVLSNKKVLGFIARFWMRRPILLTACVVLTLVSVGFDLALPPAIHADVIDHDTVRSGEQRSGLYFAAWSFITKLSLAPNDPRRAELQTRLGGAG